MKIRNLVNRWLPQKARRPLRTVYLRTANTLKHRDPYFISQINIEISAACNRKCSYCPVSLYPSKQSLIEDDVFDLILDRIREIGWTGPVDYIHYNEPLLHPEIVGLVERTKRALPKAHPIMITSNGDKLDVPLARRLITAGAEQFNVTRHPPHSDKWDRRMDEVRRTFPGHVHFLNSPGDEGWTNRAGLIEPPGPSFLVDTCHSPENLTITKDAKIVLCCNDFFKAHIMGDLKTQTLREVYYGEPMATLRREVRRGDIKLDMCKKCLSIA